MLTGGRLCISLILLQLSCLLIGCNRSHYREAANEEVSYLVAEKSNNPRWMLPGFTIETDPRSRIHDPYDPDAPPMPPDDPYSHVYMHQVDGMKGYKKWHRNGSITELENPGWRELLYQDTNLTPDGKIVLTLEEVLRLAMLNSSDYQSQLETIFLSALDVSTERFRFDVQFFGGNLTQYEHLGSERAGGESNTLRTDTDFELNRQFATAGELLVNFANSWVWEFTGPNTGFTTSVLNFSFVQPLLRAGGRAVALEQLTIAERGLLANLRAWQRFRKGFYTEVAIGQSGVDGPSRRGGFFGGTGLTGFSGTGSSGFGGVGNITGFGGGGFNIAGGTGGGAGFAGGGAGTIDGFLGLLQRQQQIRNTEDSLNAQLRTLALLEANLDAGLIDIAQVDQFRQNIETERANLLQSRNAFQNTLETFLRGTMGLPPDIAVYLDDSVITPFQFIDAKLRSVERDVDNFVNLFGELPLEPTIEQLNDSLMRMQQLKQKSTRQFERVPEDISKFQQALPIRFEQMDTTQQAELTQEMEKLQSAMVRLRDRYDSLMPQLDTIKAQLNPQTRKQTADRIVEWTTDLSNILGELALVQARARLEQITIEPIELPSSLALEIARANRLDWMNNRAALVDTWRLIEFNANALKSDLTVRFSGGIDTLGGDNPVKFRSETGALRASVEIDPPFTRLVERNTFRQQLIEYQQSRRRLIAFEDGVHQSMRVLLRDLDQLRENLEIQRKAVGIAIRRVDQTQEVLNRPIAPAQPGQAQQTLGPTAAQNLLFALSDLRNTQNNLMSVWLNYRARKMQLYRELGIMQIDENGRWMEIPLDVTLSTPSETNQTPPPVPEEWIEQLKPAGPELKLQPPPAPPAPPAPPKPMPPAERPNLKARQKTIPEFEPAERLPFVRLKKTLQLAGYQLFNTKP